MENHAYGPTDGTVNGDTTQYIVGNPDAPYINDTLVPQGTRFTSYFANAHPSLPNYLDLTAGTNGGCTRNSCATDSLSVDDLFHQLGAAGRSFATFAQSLPSPCFMANSLPYVVHHDPEPYFTNIDAASGASYGCPSTDLPYPGSLPDPLPDFTFVVPDNCHNMHGTAACPSDTDQIIRDGDTWLSQVVPSFLARGAVVVVTFDEAESDSTNGGGHVLTVIDGTNVAPGTIDAHAYSHFGLLAGLEDYFGLSRLAAATTSAPVPIPTVPPPPPPTITDFDPTAGVASDTVTITGQNFTGATAVGFAGTSATFTVTDDTSIAATVPAGADTGPISVSTPGGTAISSSDFTVTRRTLAGVSLASGKGGTSSSFTTSTVSPVSGVAFLWVFDSFATGTPSTVTGVTGLSGTWAKVQDVVSVNGHRRLSLWYATGCSSSGPLVVTLSAGSQSAIRYTIDGFTGGIDPATPFVATNVKAAAAAAKVTSIGVTPSGLASPNDLFYVGLNHSVAQDVTPLNGASEVSDSNALSAAGIETNDLPGWIGGVMGGMWATASRQSVILGIEIRAAGT